MMNTGKTSKALVAILLAAGLCGSLIVLQFAGCTETLTGDQFTNQAPLVRFANIPPDNQQFSRNPEVYWIGTDNDGLIDYYRYIIVTEDELGAVAPMDYVATIDDDDWTYVDVDPTQANPQSAQVIPLSADPSDPVNNFVVQYVFLQAYDDKGAGSAIVYRVLNRNDNPPETSISNVSDQLPFVNAKVAGGIITGVRLRWSGSDRKDYEEQGLAAPPFDFEWRLYGPYTSNEIDTILNSFAKPVFVTEDARVFNTGGNTSDGMGGTIYLPGDTLVRCDTFIVDTNIGGNDTSYVDEMCDTVVFYDTTSNTAFYRLDSVLAVDSLPLSEQVDHSFDGVSTWVKDTRDTLYDVYRAFATDTTVRLNFIFWLRSRDDALVADVTPEYIVFDVIEPKFERSVAVLDFSEIARTNYSGYGYDLVTGSGLFDQPKAFWYNALNKWADNNLFVPLVFDTSFYNAIDDPNVDPNLYGGTGKDYIYVQRFSDLPLNDLLKHKLMILYNEGYLASGFADQTHVVHTPILQAIDAGVNAWATWRAPVVGGPGQIAVDVRVPSDYTRYFGVDGMVYSHWFLFAKEGNKPAEYNPTWRIEDFVGAYSLKLPAWPDLAIDTALLHQRHLWVDSDFPVDTSYRWIDTLGDDDMAALPEVNWSQRSFGTDVLYLYKSLYGSTHPVGEPRVFEGSPVAHRLETNLFRTAHFNFTPLALDSVSGQIMIDSVLNWLYEPWFVNKSAAGKAASVVTENRFPNAKVFYSIEEARQHADRRAAESYMRQTDKRPYHQTGR